MARLDITGLSHLPSAAAMQFYADWHMRAQDMLDPSPLTVISAGGLEQATSDHLTLVFSPADHTHDAWRLAAVQMLARENTPHRVNAVASDDPAAIEAALLFLSRADGLTGQYLPLDSAGSAPVLDIPA